MFSKISRYRKLSDIVTSDAKGRTLKSKNLRLVPEISGEFFHTIEEIDRLDHLAYKYYKQPRKWWRICDANPGFISPQALLGKDSIKTIPFPILWEGPIPPWSDLLHMLSEMVGIDEAKLGSPDQPFADIQIIDGALMCSIDSSWTADLDSGIRTQVLSIPLRQALEDNGIILEQGVNISFAGDNKWRITETMSKQVYTLRPEGDILNVYESELIHTWILIVSYNEMNINPQSIADQISTFGFSVVQSKPIGRIGKQIVIPSDVIT